jgi:hypothetical protein
MVPSIATAQNIQIGPPVAAAVAEAPQTAAPAPAFVYSDAYHARARIHKIGSAALIPLFVTQGILGSSIYNHPTDGKKSWHKGIAWGIGGLFAVNSVTGATNLIVSRKDPNGRKLRVIHALLMMAADAGFLATAITAPDSSKPDFTSQRSTHRAIAFTSIGVATTGYLLMLFGHK